MGSKPLISEAQWRKITKFLPPKMCDQTMIEAILFREFSGRSLTEVAELFGVTRIRLHTWRNALEADGTLARIMAALKLAASSGTASFPATR